MSDLDDYVTVAQAAVMLARTVGGILRKIARGRLKAARVGRNFLIERASVEREFARMYPNYAPPQLRAAESE